MLSGKLQLAGSLSDDPAPGAFKELVKGNTNIKPWFYLVFQTNHSEVLEHFQLLHLT